MLENIEERGYAHLRFLDDEFAGILQRQRAREPASIHVVSQVREPSASASTPQ
jgi:hypothetical protein